MEYQGFYINLTRSENRNQSMINQLNLLDFGHLYKRFNAIEASFEGDADKAPMKNAELGCWLSHIAVIKQSMNDDMHLHILEDDALLNPILSTIPSLFNWLDDQTDWDIVFTDVYFHPPPSPENFYRFIMASDQFKKSKKLELISLNSINVTGLTSYFINKRSLKKVYALLKDQWQSGKTIDIFIAQLIKNKQLNAFVTAPFITSINPDLSSVSTIGDYGASTSILDLLRRSLYIGSTADNLYQEALNKTENQLIDPRIGLYAESIKTVLGSVKSI
jgi:GR25 family glycosyltransferase involved in LPS biosynthesis